MPGSIANCIDFCKQKPMQYMAGFSAGIIAKAGLLRAEGRCAQ